MCKATEYTQKLLEDITTINNEVNRLSNIVHTCDLKICDVMHDIELSNSKDMYSAWLLVKEIKEIRQKRRQAKDEIETLRILRRSLDQAGMLKILNNTKLNINKEKDKMQHRVYNIRTDVKITNLQI